MQNLIKKVDSVETVKQVDGVVPVIPVIHKQTQIHDIPPSSIHGRSLKKLKSYKEIRRCYKNQNMMLSFTSDLQFVLNEFKPDENQFDDELLVEILNLCEAYFFYPHDKVERERMKLCVVEELMLKYFNNDMRLLHKTIGHVTHRVKKSTMLNRVYKRFKLYLFKKD